MVIFSNCKINLGLQIVSKREDGFHNLETIFYPIPFYDVIEIIEAKEFLFTSTGLEIDGKSDTNLCVKAYNLLKKDFAILPNMHLHLQKNIPMGAGIGGGSANAAYTLQLINKKFDLNISKEELKTYASELGSDCSFFIENQTCFASGRGEILSPIVFHLNDYTILLLFPGIHISTKNAFENIVPKNGNISLQQIIKEPIETWKNKLTNDFEQTAFSAHPILQDYKNELYNLGALYASMSGSGSTIYGIFNKNQVENIDVESSFKNCPYKLL
jgi:4-diphosphocytidyl-2-C-methyl-D-erythritol kinase